MNEQDQITGTSQAPSQSNVPAGDANTPSAPVADNGGNTPAPSGEGKQESSKDDNIDWQKRYSDSSTEAKRLKDERDKYEGELKATQEATLQFAIKDRDTFTAYLDHQKLSAPEREQYLTWYDTEYSAQNKTEGTSNNTEGTPPANVSIDQMVDPMTKGFLEQGRKQYEDRVRSQNEAWRSWNSKEEVKNLPEKTKQAIAATAHALDENFGYSPSDAIAEAERRILNVDSVRGEGYAEGMRDANYLGGRTNRGISGAGSRGDNGPRAFPGHHENFVQQEINRKGWTADSNEAKAYRERYAKRAGLNK